MFSCTGKILVEIILGWTDFLVFFVFSRVNCGCWFLITFLLFQLFRLGCRTFWRGRGTGPGDKDEVGWVI
jgi:hypothetical protein